MSDSQNDTLAGKPAMRILVPVNANDDASWGLHYAARRKRAGRRVEVILLHVSDPAVPWQLLRFRTQRQIEQWHSDRSDAIFAAAGQRLAQAGIDYCGVRRHGDLVFSILDAAEELACRRIVMPLENPAWMRWLSRDIVHRVRMAARDVPVIMVNRNGLPTRASGARQFAANSPPNPPHDERAFRPGERA